METWRKVWRDGFAPVLSTNGLQALRTALLRDDPALNSGPADVAAATPKHARLAGRGRVCTRLLRMAR